ncbi:unnamed protein product [Didymodactylos carnosus]|uniref:Uncharacterized protein n=1 Tax=Didymodactylos carnosus TaxID=1234261 RepID=A0A814CQ66_9BILA|nr:unnamed protein product [Didymodactylos carnosus]CAF1040818.1 unnamed protein product [Didymodactylos carnosus]CAF3720123.1 unnamed protein product [Didymodactylos carnosus]CAF3808975.1 unnamed protein product [Didymodactylos carnosus]
MAHSYPVDEWLNILGKSRDSVNETNPPTLNYHYDHITCEKIVGLLLNVMNQMRDGEHEHMNLVVCLISSLIECKEFDVHDLFNKFHYSLLTDEKQVSFEVLHGQSKKNKRSDFIQNSQLRNFVINHDYEYALTYFMPLSLFYYRSPGDCVELVKKCVVLTYGENELLSDVCQYYSTILCGALQNLTKNDLLNEGFYEMSLKNNWHAPLNTTVEKIAKGSFKTREYIPLSDNHDISDSLALVLWTLYNDENSLENGILIMKKMNISLTTIIIYVQMASILYDSSFIEDDTNGLIIQLGKWLKYAGDFHHINTSEIQINFEMHISEPSYFGRITQKVWGTHSIIEIVQNKINLDSYLPNSLQAFRIPTLKDKTKKYFFYSKPIIWTSRSQIQEKRHILSDQNVSDIFTYVQTDTTIKSNRYSFVILSDRIIIARVPETYKFTYHILSKHITLSNRSLDVRFAGEIWKDENNKIYINNNSGTYRPPNDLIELATAYLNRIFSNMNIEGRTFDESARPPTLTRCRRKVKRKILAR